MNEEFKTDIKVLEDKSEQAHAAVMESRLSLEMVLEKHSEDLEKQRKHYCRIIYALILTLLLLVGSALGGIIYILCNYDIGVITYSQDVDADNGSTSMIEDGIHFSKN